MILEKKEEFKKSYGNILGILNTEVNTMAVHTLVQFYGPPLRCFTFQDYHLAHTLEEYSHILVIGIKNQVPYVCIKNLPKSHILAEALHLEKKEVEMNLKIKGGISHVRENMPSSYFLDVKHVLWTVPSYHRMHSSTNMFKM